MTKHYMLKSKENTPGPNKMVQYMHLSYTYVIVTYIAILKTDHSRYMYWPQTMSHDFTLTRKQQQQQQQQAYNQYIIKSWGREKMRESLVKWEFHN